MDDLIQNPDFSIDEAAYTEGVIDIYREGYAENYPSLYTAPWHRKHELNLINLTRIQELLPSPGPRWLDIACGQAWHFSKFPGWGHMVGMDISRSQLVRARANAPFASFVQADMAGINFPEASFDLVTNFWAGYCYLKNEQRIGKLILNIVRWLKPGGVFYMEVLLPHDLESFNRSTFSNRTGFTVSPISADYTKWQYDDLGGKHVMLSPPLEFFLDLLLPQFREIEAHHDNAFMIHLIAFGKIN